MELDSLILELLAGVKGVMGFIPCPVIIPPFLLQTSHFNSSFHLCHHRLTMEYVLSKQEIFYSKRNDKGSVGVEIRNLPAFQFNNINGKGVIRSFDSVLKAYF